jgi:hypothetical protein
MAKVPAKKPKVTPIKPALSRESRITKEEKRLRDIYKNLPDDVLKVVDGLIRRAANMRIALEDYEIDLDRGGYVELFSQSPTTEPYERERPVARLYTTWAKAYQGIINDLAKLLPKEQPKEDDDGFDDFVAKR